MFLIDALRALFILCFALADSAIAHDPPPRGATVNVSILLGDTESVTAAEAIRLLRSDPALSRFRFHAYPTSGLQGRDLTPLHNSRLIIVNTVGRNLAETVAPLMKFAIGRGAHAFAVGPSWDDKLADHGFLRDPDLVQYMNAGGPRNVANMIRLALRKEFALAGDVAAPEAMPEFGAIDLSTGAVFASFDEYRASRPRSDRPWIGVAFYRTNAVSGQLATVRAITASLEKRGYNVIPFFGFPAEQTLERFAFESDGKPALAALAALSLKISNNPATLAPLLKKLDVPVVNLITLNSQSRAQFESSAQGLDLLERSWQVGGAELGGAVAPTVVASKEAQRDAATGLDLLVETPMPARIDRAAERLARWAALRTKPNAEKRVTVIYYNYPPGKEVIGASYLNVLPGSLWNMIQRLKDAGYDVSGAPDAPDALLASIRDRGGNISKWRKGSIEHLVKEGVEAGTVQLLPVAIYRKWFDALDPELRAQMVKSWGEPESSELMVWRNDAGEPFFAFPVHRFGGLLLAPQPTRGWEQSPEKIYHDLTLPPNHHYMAFYLWLQQAVDVDAMIHVGTHATHEWHSGREVGFTDADPGELFVGSVPQLYPYIIDDVGEALQAKRRAMALMISHLTPPIDKASLNPELIEINQLITDWKVAKERSEAVSEAVLTRIDEIARKQGLLKDVALEAVRTDDDIDILHDHVRAIGEKLTPFGLHTFGQAPTAEQRRATAEAIVSLDEGLSDDAKREKIAGIERAIELSGDAELNAIIAGLGGRYIAPGPGNDPIRSPEALPTGRNIYGFDPSRMPNPATWALGEKLAVQFVADFRAKKNEWPTRVVMNLWGVESSRHEGVMEAQIMALMGVRPTWDARGRVSGVELIAREALGRPRVDVTIIPSGLYRDLFPLVMQRLDEAVTLAAAQNEPDNPIRKNIDSARSQLIAEGVDAARAQRLASVRMFSVPSGAYGTNLNQAIPLSNTYGDKGAQTDAKIADIYFMRMHHAFGQGFWGESTGDRPGLGVDLLKRALSGAQSVIHSRSSNIYGAMDGDDFYQYLGGTALAVRAVDGKTPDVFVTNMANPRRPVNESLERYLGREIRARYLNPKWIEAMMAEGYAGAKFVTKVVEHLYGWQVTVPEAVGDEKWQEIHETWVEDRHNLNIREKFRESGNLLAYQAMVDRMLVAVRKGYWQADAAVIEKLEATNRELIAEVGVACTPDTCSSPDIVQIAMQQEQRLGEQMSQRPAPGAQAMARATAAAQAARPMQVAQASGSPPNAGASPSASGTPAPSQNPHPNDHSHAADPLAQNVTGYAVEEKTVQKPAEKPAQGAFWLLLIGVAVFFGGFGMRFGRP